MGVDRGEEGPDWKVGQLIFLKYVVMSLRSTESFSKIIIESRIV